MSVSFWGDTDLAEVNAFRKQRDALLAACKSARELLMVMEEGDHAEYTRSFMPVIKQLDDAIATTEAKED